ncbi:hypothetical protein WNZ14_16425 [Hoeflea sp. AS60]|uniref:hypothetical protein n=1 Tax=Hoeflea sp. AS60 TaxID=3135780 RepID=UPI00317E9228
MTIQFTSKRLFSASVFVAALSGFTMPAMALDADDFATKLSAMTSQTGTKLSFSAVEPDGSTVVLKSVRVESPGKPAFDMGDVTFKGVEEEDDGSYFVDEAVFDTIEITERQNKVSIDGIEVSGLTVPVDATASSLDGIVGYEGFSTGEISVENAGANVFSMAGLELDIERADDESQVKMLMTGSDLKIDLSQVKDPKAKDALTQLGYENLTGDLKLDGSWDKQSGIINMKEYSLTLDDVGRLALALEISGYTPEFITSMQQVQSAAAANPDPQAAQQARGFAMLGMLQQLSFKSASIRFEDGSLTEKALGYAGKQQGVSGDDMRMALKGMLPLMLGQLGIPALQQQISAAASTYLDNPENLTISAIPANPVAVPVLMGAGMGDPRSLVDLLNVQVTANKPL